MVGSQFRINGFCEMVCCFLLIFLLGSEGNKYKISKTNLYACDSASQEEFQHPSLEIIEITEHSKIIKPLSLFFTTAMFRGDSGKTLLQIAYAVPNRELNFQRSLFGRGKSPINIVFEFTELDNGTVQRVNEQIVVWSNEVSADPRGYLLNDKEISILPGIYDIQMQATSVDSSRFGRRKAEKIAVPNFSGDSLAVSSIQLAYRIDDPVQNPHLKGSAGLHVVPYPFRKVLRNYPIFAYFRIYNLKQDSTETARYSIDYKIFRQRKSISIFSRLAGGSKNKLILHETIQRVNAKPPVEDYIFFDLEKYEPGMMLMVIAITDEVTGSTAESALSFGIINNPSQLLP